MKLLVTASVRHRNSFITQKTRVKLFAWGFERFGRSGLQTNGVLITHDHVRLFKRYNVRVSVSIDGPSSLNRARWAGSVGNTDRATRNTEDAIEMLCVAL